MIGNRSWNATAAGVGDGPMRAKRFDHALASDGIRRIGADDQSHFIRRAASSDGADADVGINYFCDGADFDSSESRAHGVARGGCLYFGKIFCDLDFWNRARQFDFFGRSPGLRRVVGPIISGDDRFVVHCLFRIADQMSTFSNDFRRGDGGSIVRLSWNI